NRCGFYVRYSDDILVLENDEEKSRETYNFSTLWMERHGLMLKEAKTQLHRLTEKDGFEYLGYAFSSAGKTIPEKAKSSLATRLETMWLTSGLKLEEKIAKGQEILGGWEQYYREERTIGSILEFVVVLSMARNKKPEVAERIESQRFSFVNYYRDIVSYMTAYWRQRDCLENEIREYEQFFQAPEEEKKDASDEALLNELCLCYQHFFIQPNEEMYTTLIQLYTDMGYYRKASFFWEEKTKYEQSQRPVPVVQTKDVQGQDEDHSSINLADYFSLFAGREDTYVREILSDGSRRVSEQVPEPLTEDVMKKTSGRRSDSRDICAEAERNIKIYGA
ncbi:MAG: hypothetical protein LIO96_12320, partial [Lachnospiraceae bacterium]|nr:hypothetical protein [Lachnospiraceae bacterium]